jgi:hypothetical protein
MESVSQTKKKKVSKHVARQHAAGTDQDASCRLRFWRAAGMTTEGNRRARKHGSSLLGRELLSRLLVASAVSVALWSSFICPRRTSLRLSSA